MHLLLSFVGFVAGCALVGASFGYVFAPAETQRLLRTVGTAAGLILFVLLAVANLAHDAGPFAFMVAMVVVSSVAYFVRARRMRHPERPKRLGGAERKPVIPRNIPGGGG
jgi:hypothetical protein